MAPEVSLWLLTPNSMAWWVGATSVLYLVQVFYLYRYFLATIGNQAGSRIIGLVLASAAPWLIAGTTAEVAIFYLTGSINYFWMGVLFLAALYTPFYVTLVGNPPAAGYVWVSLGCSLIVAVSHEQFGMELVLLSGLALMHRWWQERRDRVWRGPLGVLAAQFALSASVFALAMLSPGNSKRFAYEMAKWIPDLYTVPWWVRGESGLRWFLDRFINHSGLTLIVVWLLVAYLVWAGRKWVAIALMVAAGMLSALSLMPLDVAGFQLLAGGGFAAWGDFHATWGFHGGLKSWVAVLFWVVLLGLTVVGTWNAFPANSGKAMVAVALLAGSFIGLAALLISPVMYASKFRLGYASSLILTVLIVMLVSEALGRRRSGVDVSESPH